MTVPLPFLTASLPTCSTTSIVYTQIHSVDVPPGKWNIQYAGFASGEGKIRVYIPKIGARVAARFLHSLSSQLSFSLEGMFDLDESTRLEMQITCTGSKFMIHTPCVRLIRLDNTAVKAVSTDCNCEMAVLLRSGGKCGGQ